MTHTPPRSRWHRRVGRAALGVAAAAALTVGALSVPNAAIPTASALPCPDGTQTCGPQPTFDPGPTQGPAPTTAPHAAETTVPGYTPDNPPQANQGSINTPTVQGGVRTMPTPEPTSDTCIFNCGTPTQQQPVPTQQPETQQQQPTATQAPTQTRQQSNLHRKCSEAKAQLNAGSLPELVGGGVGRSPVFVIHPRSPGGGIQVCSDCADQAMNEFTDSLNDTQMMRCRTVSGPQYLGQGTGALLAGPAKLGAAPRTVTFTVETTREGQKVTTSDATSLGANVGVAFGPIQGGVEASKSKTREVVAPSSSINTTKSGEISIDAQHIYPDVPLSQSANYNLEMVQNVSRFVYKYSCTAIDGTPTPTLSHEVDVVTSVDVVAYDTAGAATPLYSIGW